MSDEKIYHTDLYIDVHLDVYLSVTRLSERRWRIGALMQPREATTEQWWVHDARLSLTFTGGPSVTAIAVAADAGTATEPRLWEPDDIARQLGYRQQTDARVRASSQAMTHARFDFTVDPDVTGMVQLGYLFFSQEFDRQLLHDAHKFLTAVPYGTVASGDIVVGTPYQEIWWTDEDIEPGEDAGMYSVVPVEKVAGEGRPCAHDWCNGLGAEPQWLEVE